MIRVAVYCRLSEEDRNKKSVSDESESIQNQKSLLTSYCKSQGWNIQDIYCDEDMSGADRDRPEFNRMLSDCRKGLVDIVLCKTQSRFSRDIEVVEHFIHNRFREWGVRFIGLLDHADTEDVANKKSRQINGLVNEWYLEDLSENIKRTLRHKKEKGIFTGAFAPYGYRLDAQRRGMLFPDEVAAEHVRKIFYMYLSGFGYVKIAQELNRSGVLCPSEYKRLSGSRFKTHSGRLTSKIWTDNTVRNILKNPVYMGTLVQGKTTTVSYKSKKRIRIAPEDYIVTENAHEPIVDADVWNRVNNKGNVPDRMQKTDGKRHIFSGRIFCAECGSSMWKMSYQLKNGRYEYLRCKATKCDNSVCFNKSSIPLDEVRNCVESEMKILLERYYTPEKVRLSDLHIKGNERTKQEENFIRERILKQNLNIKQLYKDKLNGIIDNEMYYEIYKELNDDLLLLKKRLGAISQTAKQTKDVRAEELAERLVQVFSLDETSVSLFVDKITVGIPCDGKRKITVYWKF